MGSDLERLVTNLVSNALKFTNPPGWVRVELVPGPTSVRIVVADNGIVESIVTRHDGTVSVASQQDGGSRFVVELPLLSLADVQP